MSRRHHERPDEMQVTPVDIYHRHGDLHPSAAKLDSMHGRLGRSNAINTMLVAADICIDRAVVDIDEEQTDTYLGMARTHLDDIVSHTDLLEKMGYERTYEEASISLALAHIRLAELSQWAAAAKQEPVTDNYPELLRAAAKASSLILGEGVKPRLVEFMPVLLGARLRHQDPQARRGWFGRLALSREDQRADNLPTQRSNWDTGVVFRGDPKEFDKPPVKLQVKTSRAETVTKYKRAGVLTVVAERYGFDDPAGIIAACLDEAGLYEESQAAGELADGQPPEPIALDTIARGLKGAFLRWQSIQLRTRFA